jgi:hypothetical protein
MAITVYMPANREERMRTCSTRAAVTSQQSCPKTVLHEVSSTDIRGDPPYLEGSFRDTDPKPTENWGGCRQYHRRAILGLNVLHTPDAAVDRKGLVLQLGIGIGTVSRSDTPLCRKDNSDISATLRWKWLEGGKVNTNDEEWTSSKPKDVSASAR